MVLYECVGCHLHSESQRIHVWRIEEHYLIPIALAKRYKICLRTTLVSSTVVDFIRKINPIPGQAHTNVLWLGNGMLVSLYHRFQGEGTISLWHWPSWNGLTTNTQPSSGFRLQALDLLCYCVLNGKQDWTCRHNLGLAIVLQL